MIMSGAFFGFFKSPGFKLASQAEDSSFTKVLVIIAYAPPLLFQLRVLGRSMRTFLLAEPFILLMVAWALASNSWSVVPEATLFKSLQLFFTLVYASYLAARFSWSELTSIARLALRLGLLLSIVVTLIKPDWGIASDGIHTGKWLGLYLHKNTFGRVGGLLVTLSVAQVWSGLSRSRQALWFDVILGTLVILLSGSRTALAVVLLVIFSLALARGLMRTQSSLRLALASLLLLCGLIVAPLSLVLASWVTGLNWDVLLTGRVSLWKTVLYLASQRPLTGFGYSAFFHEAAFGRLILLFERWPVPHAHNMMLELAANLGFLAVPIYLSTLLLYAYRTQRLPGAVGLLPLGVLLMNVVTGLTETACYPSTEISGLLFLYFALSLSGQDVPRQTETLAREPDPRSEIGLDPTQTVSPA